MQKMGQERSKMPGGVQIRIRKDYLGVLAIKFLIKKGHTNKCESVWDLLGELGFADKTVKGQEAGKPMHAQSHVSAIKQRLFLFCL